jgi:purine-nucleoside phosphorylase
VSETEKVQRAVSHIAARIGDSADVGMILGSGLGALADSIGDPVVIPYDEIPGFPRSLIPGHRGEVRFGTLHGKRVLLFSGRFHYYQGYSMGEVVIPVRAASRLKVHTMIVTNASGGMRDDLDQGDIMLIRDHINLMGDNPLRGIPPGEFGSPFVDMSEPYDPALIERIRAVAGGPVGELKEGVYAGVAGPSYETAAEIRFLQRIGADAVGMSTVPEVIACRQEKIRVVGISAIVNRATGLSRPPAGSAAGEKITTGGRDTASPPHRALAHEDVVRRASEISGRMMSLIDRILEKVL